MSFVLNKKYILNAFTFKTISLPYCDPPYNQIFNILSLQQEYNQFNLSDVYAEIIFNRTAQDVTKFEAQNGKAPFTPSWIVKITWDHVLPVSYQKINMSEVSIRQNCSIFYYYTYNPLKQKTIFGTKLAILSMIAYATFCGEVVGKFSLP